MATPRRSTQDKLKTYLVDLARRRKNSKVTADDAHRFLDREGVMNGKRLSLINTVFNSATDRFTATGTRRSERPVARGRKITTWQLTT